MISDQDRHKGGGGLVPLNWEEGSLRKTLRYLAAGLGHAQQRLLVV